MPTGIWALSAIHRTKYFRPHPHCNNNIWGGKKNPTPEEEEEEEEEEGGQEEDGIFNSNLSLHVI